MNSNAQAWVAALRSGRFRQGTDKLGWPDGRRCCLGVACEVAIEAGLEVSKTTRIGPDEDVVFDGSWSDLPPSVREWLGLATPNGEPADGPPLSNRNDSGQTFAEIADFIDSEPRGLFA